MKLVEPQDRAWQRVYTLSQSWLSFTVHSAYHPLQGRDQAGAEAGCGGGAAEEENQAGLGTVSTV